MNSTIVAAIIVVGTGGLALLIWWLNHRLNGRKSASKTTSEWTSEGDTSFVSKSRNPQQINNSRRWIQRKKAEPVQIVKDAKGIK